VVILKCKLRSRANTPPDEENFDPQDYQNFDDFAQRSSQAKQGQLFNQPLIAAKWVGNADLLKTN